MPRFDFESLHPFEGKTVLLTSTEGEVMKATLQYVDKEHEDVVVDVLETNRPGRNASLGWSSSQASWIIPFQFIRSIETTGVGGECPESSAKR